MFNIRCIYNNKIGIYEPDNVWPDLYPEYNNIVGIFCHVNGNEQIFPTIDSTFEADNMTS